MIFYPHQTQSGHSEYYFQALTFSLFWQRTQNRKRLFGPIFNLTDAGWINLNFAWAAMFASCLFVRIFRIFILWTENIGENSRLLVTWSWCFPLSLFSLLYCVNTLNLLKSNLARTYRELLCRYSSSHVPIKTVQSKNVLLHVQNILLV